MPRRLSRYEIPTALAGERADKLLAAVAGISRSTARRLCEEGLVTIDDVVAAASDRRVGRSIAAPIPGPGAALVAEPDVAFTVIYQDAALLVVDKPAGVVVHPGAGTVSGTLAAGLIARYPELVELAATARWGIVHRLDKETSGLLLVARTEAVYVALQDQLRRRAVTRTYLSLVAGGFDSVTGTIEAPLGRDPAQPTRRAVVRGGKEARTHYRRLAWWDQGLTLLEVHLETGRTHQIRVHLAAIGHPVIGDRSYGRRGGPGDPGRTWLHAAALAFTHPTTGAGIEATAPLPDDLAASLRTLGPPTVGAAPVDSSGEGAT